MFTEDLIDVRHPLMGARGLASNCRVAALLLQKALIKLQCVLQQTLPFFLHLRHLSQPLFTDTGQHAVHGGQRLLKVSFRSILLLFRQFQCRIRPHKSDRCPRDASHQRQQYHGRRKDRTFVAPQELAQPIAR
ncbi:MAG: hypothetical protein HY000_13410 [Planctomycetes bacterium]|nr:hypothetical protein [Planctomycetota bacterium]